MLTFGLVKYENPLGLGRSGNIKHPDKISIMMAVPGLLDGLYRLKKTLVLA